MDDKQLEERLDLLKSSYERVPSNFDVEDVINKIENEKVPPVYEERHKASKWQKVTVWAVSLASVFIIGVLGSMFLVKENRMQGEEQLSESVKEFMDRLKKEYPVEREKRREMLNLPEEEFSKIEFISSADSRFQFYTDPKYTPFMDGTIYTDLEKRYDEIMDQLKLPSEMVKDIHNRAKLNKEETTDFLDKYYYKVYSFNEYANEKLEEYKNEISAYNVDNLYNINKILENERFLSKEFQNLRKNAQNQSLQLEVIEDGIDIRFHFNYLLTSTLYSGKFDPIADSYLLMMNFEPFTYAWELIYPMDTTSLVLSFMEKALVTGGVGIPRMDTYYTSVFYLLVKGTIENPVFDENGVVKEEYKVIWRTMANEETNSPSPYLLIPIVKEFELTGWKKSEAWDDFSYGDINDALHLAKNGDLEQFMPERLAVNNAGNEMLVDEDFLQRVHALYKSFAGTHDQTVLKDAKPEEIVGLYFYCVQLEDYETQYELYIKDDDYIQIPKEEYMSAPHQQLRDIREEFTSLRFEQRSDEEGYVFFTLDPNRTLYLKDTVIGFAVIHTENGWRAAFMPTQ